MTTYDRRALAQAYIDAHPENKKCYAKVHQRWNDALRVHRQQMVSGLQDLFDLTLDQEAVAAGHTVVFELFEATVRSYLAITNPWTDYAFSEPEVLRQSETWATVLEASDRIHTLNKQTAEAHLDILDAYLAVMLGDRAAQVFTSQDLRAIGIDDTAPNPDSYREEWEDF